MEKVVRMIVKKKLISDAEFERQLRAAKQRPVTEPAATSAVYKNGEIHINLASGWHFSFPPKRFSEFKKATEGDLKKVGLTGRYTLSCEPLDVDISIGGILVELVGVDRRIRDDDSLFPFLAVLAGELVADHRAHTGTGTSADGPTL